MTPDEINAIIRREVANVAFREVSDTDRLLEDRILDSVGAVDLAVALEGAFGVNIPFVDINAQHFASVDSIAAYIQLKRG